MKKINKFLIMFLLSFFTLCLNTYADTYYGVVIEALNVRSGAGTNYSKITTLSAGTTVTLNNTTLVSGTGCDSGWYEITYSGSTAYVCSEYITVRTSSSSSSTTASTTCEKAMEAAGFPSSYWSGLCSLQEDHPNWEFVALDTGLLWSYVVEKESTCGRSYIQTSNSDFIDTSCTNQYGSSSSWKNASKTAVAYYMDPRNFFSEKYIFQFEYLQYSSSLSSYYTSGVKSIFSGASFYTYHTNLGNDLASILNTVGSSTNVSPTFLAARIRQEMGTGTTLYNLYSGVYSGYEGYYNFYNYGVTDSCANTSGTTICGLTYAKNNNWYGLEAALKGGASSIASSYISVGQYTTYLQKFNVVPTKSSNLFIHQYMTNLTAPSSESSTTYSTYKSLGILDLNYVFYIPVYLDMDDEIDNSSSGASSSTSSSTSTSSISSIVKTSGYTYSSGYLTGITPGTTVDDVISDIEAIAGSGNITVSNSGGTTLTSGNIATGYKVKITNSSGSEELTVIIYGDTSGDGVINAKDLLQVQKQILGTTSLTGAYLKAADTSKDGNVNAKDLLQVQKQILGTSSISQ